MDFVNQCVDKPSLGAYYPSMEGRGVGDVEHPVRRIVFRQGRTLTWIARQLGISSNYLHRMLLPAEHPDHRPPPEDFYSRLSQLLGVPEDMLVPTEKVVPDTGLARA